VWLRDAGSLWIGGRADQTILRGGFKVQPETVRVALLRHPAIVDAVVFGVDDERLGQEHGAVVQHGAGESVTDTEVVEHARGLLAPYEVPVTVVVVDALPRTP